MFLRSAGLRMLLVKVMSAACIQYTLSSRAALGRVRRASKGILHTSQLLQLNVLGSLQITGSW